MSTASRQGRRINGCDAHNDVKFTNFRKLIREDTDDWTLKPSWEPSRAQIRATLGRRNRIAKVASGDQLNAPLHAKTVAPMQLARLMLQMRDPASKRIANLMDTLEKAPFDKSEVSARFRVPTADAQKLRKAGAIEPFNGDDYTPVRYFTVYEALKNRRRPIMWPWTFLWDSDYRSEFSLANVSDYCKSVFHGQYSCAFDLASSFWQVLLANCNFVVQDVKGNKWRITRMPFGVDSASEIMQTIVEELGYLACKRAGLSEDQVRLFTHIDNIMCVGDRIDVAAWRKAFLEVCLSFEVTLNDEPDNNAVSHRTEFAGIELNFLQKRVRPRQAFVDKLPSASDASRTFTDLESCVGKLMYGMAILQMRCHQFHSFFSWWRRRLSSLARESLDWESRPFMPAEARAQLNAMLTQVADRRLVSVLRSPVMTADDMPALDSLADNVAILVVDATLWGYGGVLYERGHVVAAFGENFPGKATSMGLAEISAALGMITYFAKRLNGRRFVLLTDNTQCESGVHKGSSSHMDMDRAAFAIHAVLRDINALVLVGHVGTKDNVADAVSRSKELDVRAIEASKAAAFDVIALLGKTRVGESVNLVVGAALG
jgi:hypothetical protein